jgi:hypothetical protein
MDNIYRAGWLYLSKTTNCPCSFSNVSKLMEHPVSEKHVRSLLRRRPTRRSLSLKISYDSRQALRQGVKRCREQASGQAGLNSGEECVLKVVFCEPLLFRAGRV